VTGLKLFHQNLRHQVHARPILFGKVA
jgi:hypothetical protein